MDGLVEPGMSGRPSSHGKTSSPLLVVAPFYRNEQLVEPFSRSLLQCAEELRQLGARVIFYNDSPDYSHLATALEAARNQIGTAFPLAIHTNPQNLGWLKTCNLAMAEAEAAGADILLFNSDTRITPGAISEMVRIAQLDPMIGFVNPRSNNATLASFPHDSRPGATMDEQIACFRAASATLPDLTYVPTSIGFAMLIRNAILREFGYFDEAYGGGYNEENDLVMRASRCGYRAVLANHAYVWHEGEQSLGASSSSKRLVEAANRKILLARYPEYASLTASWSQGVETTAEKLLPTLVPGPDGRLDIAFDASHFGSYHNGTIKGGIQVIQYMSRVATHFNLHVLCERAAYDFHGLAETDVKRVDPHGPERFAAIFRIGQPFDWEALLRLSQKSAVIGVFMLDTIALDCGHLHDPEVARMWDFVFKHADFVVYNSAFTARQFELRFPDARNMRSVVSHHSLNTRDYLPPLASGPEDELIAALPQNYVLVAGNQYPHKAVGDAANRIAAALPNLPVVALGVTKDDLQLHGAGAGQPAPLGPRNTKLDNLPNLHGLLVGQISDAAMIELQSRARVVVMPSHYEGFGIPLLNALALQRPFIARRLPPLVEINEGLGRDPNVHFFDTTDDLIDLLRDPPEWRDRPDTPHLAQDGERTARDLVSIIEDAISAASYESILARCRAIQIVFRSGPGSPAAVNDPDSAARRLGQATERVMRPLMRVPFIYGAFRLAFRAARAARRSLASLRRSE
jgi:GT2 family glycosyltransferase/glycosyltransferase involved in cell wall biosynthesis